MKLTGMKDVKPVIGFIVTEYFLLFGQKFMDKMNVIELLKLSEEAIQTKETEKYGIAIRRLLEYIVPGQIKPKRYCQRCGKLDEQYNLTEYVGDYYTTTWMHGSCHSKMFDERGRLKIDDTI
jgi:hypothetical protein